MNISFNNVSYSAENSSLYIQKLIPKNNNSNSSNKSAILFDKTKLDINISTFAVNKFEDKIKKNITDSIKDPEIKKEFQEMFNDSENNDIDLEKRIDKIDKMLGKWSSDETAKRISSFVTGFYGYYTNKFNNGEKTQDNLDSFMNFVTSAVDSGFSDAKNELGAISKEVSGIIKRTHKKVHKKLDDFYNTSLEEINTNNSDVSNEEDISINSSTEFST